MAIHKHNMNGQPFVVIDNDGFLNLYTHDGHKVQCNIFIRLQDNNEGSNTVIAKFTCNIVGSLEEMNEEIKRYKIADGFNQQVSLK